MPTQLMRAILAAGLAATAVATPALAGQDDTPLPGRDPNAADVAKTPITDLNVGRDNEIPALLQTAVADPYALSGLGKCRQIATAIDDLDQVLGPDIDLPQDERSRISAGRVGKWVVASFIPFRGIIREVSGANEQDRKVNAAIQAGLARRGFLKGMGHAKGCKYPASPAPAAVVEAHRAELASQIKKSAKEERAKTKAKEKDEAKAAKLAERDKSGLSAQAETKDSKRAP